MNVELAVQYIPKRMKELGYDSDYNIRFRHYVLRPEENKQVDADDHVFILIDPDDSVSVVSDFGIFDMTADNVNELQYEHQGIIMLSNNTGQQQHIRFIQIIPKKNNNARK